MKVKNYALSAFFIQLFIFIQITGFMIYLLIHEDNTYINATLGEIDFSGDFLVLAFFFSSLSVSAYVILNRKYHKGCDFSRLSDSFISTGSAIANNKYLSFIVCTIWSVEIINTSIGIPFLSSPISFIFNLFSGAVIFLPTFSRKQKKLFVISIVLSMPVAILYGARGMVMYPVTLYLLGGWVSSNRPLLYAIKSTLFFLPLIVASSVLAVARYAARGNESFSLSTVTTLLQASQDFINNSSSIVLVGLEVIVERIVQWPMLVGIHLNGFMNGRGWGDFYDELLFALSTTNIGSDVLEVQQRIIDSKFLYGAVYYLGYQVVVGWTIPLNLIADGIIRLGLMGGVVYWLLFLLIIRLLEVIPYITKIRMHEYVWAYLPGLIFLKLSETHTFFIIKNILYLIITLLLIFLIKSAKPTI